MEVRLARFDFVSSPRDVVLAVNEQLPCWHQLTLGIPRTVRHQGLYKLHPLLVPGISGLTLDQAFWLKVGDASLSAVVYRSSSCFSAVRLIFRYARRLALYIYVMWEPLCHPGQRVTGVADK